MARYGSLSLATHHTERLDDSALALQPLNLGVYFFCRAMRIHIHPIPRP
jgi:hypothetical protein